MAAITDIYPFLGLCLGGRSVSPGGGSLGTRNAGPTPSDQGLFLPPRFLLASEYLHSGDTPWARAERASMPWRRSRGIHAAQPTAHRLRLACTQVAFRGAWTAAVEDQKQGQRQRRGQERARSQASTQTRVLNPHSNPVGAFGGDDGRECRGLDNDVSSGTLFCRRHLPPTLA